MTEEKPSVRRHPNRAEKHGLRAGDVAIFIRQYGRKAQKNTEPNDRRYSAETVRKLRRISPLELDRLMRDEEE